MRLSWHKNTFDKPGKILFPMRLLGMKTTFTKQVKLAPAYGHMVSTMVSIWQRVCCPIGNVGMKF